MPTHLLSLQEFTQEELVWFLDRALVLKKERSEGVIHRQLAGKTVGLIFEKPSTRTRVSFEAAMYGLGGQVIFLSARRYPAGQIGATEGYGPGHGPLC